MIGNGAIRRGRAATKSQLRWATRRRSVDRVSLADHGSLAGLRLDFCFAEFYVQASRINVDQRSIKRIGEGKEVDGGRSRAMAGGGAGR